MSSRLCAGLLVRGSSPVWHTAVDDQVVPEQHEEARGHDAHAHAQLAHPVVVQEVLEERQVGRPGEGWGWG